MSVWIPHFVGRPRLFTLGIGSASQNLLIGSVVCGKICGKPMAGSQRCYRHYIDELRGQRRRRTNRINPIYAGLVMALVLATSVYAECSISCEFLQRIRIRDVSDHGAGIPGGLQGWQKPSDFPQVAPNKIVWLKSATDVGSVVMGNGHGYLTASCNLKDICLKLAQTASEHHANAIASQTVKGEVIVQFLRVNEHVPIQKTK
jgi:hypothetical protein